MNKLNIKQKQYLKGLAHSLDPVVMINETKGLTPSVIKEIDISLKAHELIKVRVLGDDRAARIALIDDICEKTSSECVQHIGKLLVLYRNSDKNKISLPK